MVEKLSLLEQIEAARKEQARVADVLTKLEYASRAVLSKKAHMEFTVWFEGERNSQKTAVYELGVMDEINAAAINAAANAINCYKVDALRERDEYNANLLALYSRFYDEQNGDTE